MLRKSFAAIIMSFGFFIFSPSLLAATAPFSTQSDCPANCPPCQAVFDARLAYMKQQSDILKETVADRRHLEQGFEGLSSCNTLFSILDGISAGFGIMSFDVVAIMTAIYQQVIEKAKEFVCSFILSYVNTAINTVMKTIGLFNSTTELPYGMGNVIQIEYGGSGVTQVAPVIPSLTPMPSRL